MNLISQVEVPLLMAWYAKNCTVVVKPQLPGNLLTEESSILIVAQFGTYMELL